MWYITNQHNQRQKPIAKRFAALPESSSLFHQRRHLIGSRFLTARRHQRSLQPVLLGHLEVGICQTHWFVSQRTILNTFADLPSRMKTSSSTSSLYSSSRLSRTANLHDGEYGFIVGVLLLVSWLNLGKSLLIYCKELYPPFTFNSKLKLYWFYRTLSC